MAVHPLPDLSVLRRSTSGNRVTFFDDGEKLFEQKALAIRTARERVWIETFLFTPDWVGRATLDLLCDAARRGCDVILLFDQAGSHITNFGFYKPLLDAGGQVAIFNPLPPWRRYGRRFGSYFKNRDHRKTAVMDGAGFCGGHNFSQSYMGPLPHHFYDISVRVEGPAVRDLAGIFLDSFTETTRDARPLPPAPAPFPDGVPVRASAFDARRGIMDLIEDYHQLLNEAREEALLIFGYFVPTDALRAPIIAAAERGVRVRILTAGASDLPITRWAGQHTYGPMLAAGVRIFQLQHPHLHAKTMVVDQRLCLVGSFDVNRFERRNTAEAAVIVDDAELARAIAGGYAACMQRSEEVTLEDRKNTSRLARAGEWLSWKALGI
jgi:cardiolipin synthase A/B